MRIPIGVWRGIGAASALALLLAACSPRLDGPAPVIGSAPAQQPSTITVQRGQTLSGIAHTYHVPMSAVAEANHLSPPYRIEAGRALLIPGGGSSDGGRPAVPPAPVSVAALPSMGPEIAPRPREAIPPAPAAPPSVAAVPPSSPAPAAPPAPPLPEKPPPTEEPVPPAAKSAPPAAPSAAPESAGSPAASAPSAHGGAFAWPVRGRVLASYGPGQDGTHNDGINIAAPRGAAVQAADSGIVAYAGNELRGYGNLILVKHANGWISAYAHCDLILVKRGDKVARGQVIARVGSTGNVSEPQLHFELRRGNHAVDPREYMVPQAAAGAAKGSPPG